MRGLAVMVVVGALFACRGGDRCDPATFTLRCENEKTVASCAERDHTGMQKPFATIARLDCGREVCVSDGEFVGCVADPPVRCDVKGEKRCQAGLEQTCLGAGTSLDQEPLYWRAMPSFSCTP
jgi:hypothetical protein